MTNPFEFTVGLINLCLLFFVVKAFVIDPLKVVAREREEKAQRDMDEAEKLLAEANRHRERYQGLVAGLEAERRSLEEAGARDAESLRVRLAAEAERDARMTLDRASADARSEREAVVAALRAQVAEATVSRARTLLEGGLDSAARRDILENFLAKVGATDA